MYKVINLYNLATGRDVYKQVPTQFEAQMYLKDLNKKYSNMGYMVKHIPAAEGILFNDPEMLKVTKTFNVANPDAPENIIVFALVPCAEGEFVTITRNRMKYYSEAEDETNYNFANKNVSLEEIHAELTKENYALVRKENNMLLYKSETETFISEIYVL